MSKEKNELPNPKRVAAGRRNRRKRKSLTEDGRRRLRDAAIRNKPWLNSTGPRTAAGKAQAAHNGRKRQLDEFSVREVRREVSGLSGVLEQLGTLRWEIMDEVG